MSRLLEFFFQISKNPDIIFPEMVLKVGGGGLGREIAPNV